MRQNRQSSRLRTVTLLVPEDFAEGFRQLAFEVRARQAVGKDGAKIGWHKLNRIAEILTDLECCGRCMVTPGHPETRVFIGLSLSLATIRLQQATPQTLQMRGYKPRRDWRLMSQTWANRPVSAHPVADRWAMLDPQSRRLKTRRFSKPTMVSADHAAQLGGSGESLVKAGGDQK